MGDNNLGLDDEFMATMLGDFLDESQGYLTNLNENLLVLEQMVRSCDESAAPEVDSDLLNEMFRDAHSLKGLSAMLQLGDINSLTHKVENLFDAAREGELLITRDGVDLMFEALDRLTGMVDKLKDPDADDVEIDSVVERIGQYLQSSGVGDGQDLDAELEQALAAMQSGNAPSTEAEAAPADKVGPPQSETGDADVNNSPTQQPTAEAESTTPAEPSDPLADVTDETDIPDKYLSIFIDETEESLDALNDALLSEAETAVDPVLVLCHRIKGGAASLGLNRTAKLAHLMEDLLQELKEGGRGITVETSDALMLAVDSLRSFIDSLKKGTQQPDNFSEAYQTLRSVRAESNDADAGDSAGVATGENASLDDVASGDVAPVDSQIVDGEAAVPPSNADAAGDTASDDAPSTDAPPSGAPQSAAGFTEEERNAIAAAAPPGVPVVGGGVTFASDLPLAELKARLICTRLETLGNLFYTLPSEDQLEEQQGIERLIFGIATDSPEENIYGEIDLEGVERIDLESVAASSDKAAETTAANESLAEPNAGPNKDDKAAADKSNATSAGNESQPTSTAKPAANSQSSPTHKPAAASQRSATDASTAQKSKPTETVRVDIERLDHLMNLAGQLVINKARFGQIGDQLKDLASRKQSMQCLTNITGMLDRLQTEVEEADGVSTAGSSLLQSMQSHVQQIQRDLEIVHGDIDQLCRARTLVNDLSEAVHQLERVSDGIQKSVMDTRMVPIGPLFGRFKRVIRDITRGNGKDIRLIIRGDKTELDKRMIDELGDPLIHMVRNAADHGIETPEDRVAAGKKKQGAVTLDAFHRGNRIFVQVRDDGKGLDPEKLKAKAIDKGIISPQDAERLSRQQALQLIWEPGFSTAEQVTEVSGRGMGMDIVRSKIEGLNGTVELDSHLGEGTTITIKLPLTMAILPSLLTVIDDDVFAIPMESVSEIVRVTENDLATVHGLETARVRGRVISVVELDGLLHWHKREDLQRRTAGGERTLVIIGTDGDELGLAVDGLLGEEDIVIKSLAENYRNVSGIAGASILGDGRVSLILDVTALLDLAGSKSSSVGAATPAATA